MPKTFIISDTHFNHFNIIAYANRPFKSLEGMNYAMIERWNNTVGPNDIVWHLGDICFGRAKITLPEITQQLNGHKHLIRGNHDRLSNRTYLEAGWETVYKNFEFKHKVGDLDIRVILTHIPLQPIIMDHLDVFTINLHGHEHGYMPKRDRMVDCSVEAQGYRPILLDEAIAKVVW